MRRRAPSELGERLLPTARSRGVASPLERERRSPLTYPLYFIFATAGALAVYAVPLTFVGQLPTGVILSLSLAVVLTATILTTVVSLELFMLFWLALCFLQNFAVGVFVPDHVTLVPIYISESKTISVVFAMLFMFPLAMQNLRPYKRPLAWFICFFVAILLHISSLGGATFPYLRNFWIPLGTLFLIISLTGSWSEKRRATLITAVVWYGTTLLAVGTFLELLVGSELWREYLNVEKNSALNSLSTVTSLFGIRIERTGGFLVEPTNAGYVAAILIIVAVLTASNTDDQKKGMYWCAAICAATLLSSGAKNGILMLVVASIGGFAYSRARRVWSGLIAGWGVSFFVVFAYVAAMKGVGNTVAAFGNPISIVGGDSTTYHLAGLIAGMEHAATSFIGAGIGNGGNFARIAGAPLSLWILTGGESSWGVLAYQAGVFGIGLFLATVASLCKYLGHDSAVLLSSWTSAAMFAEALFGPQVASIVVVAAALSLVTPEPVDMGSGRTNYSRVDNRMEQQCLTFTRG